MIALYRRLGAAGPADRAAIDRALNDPSVPPDIRRIAAFVLGDPERRSVHDAAWATLSAVARLRSLMLLQMTPMWDESIAEEFGQSVTEPARMQQCLPVDRTGRH
jgi:hypothetical protein